MSGSSAFSPRQLGQSLDEAVVGLRFVRDVAQILRRPLTEAEARTTIQRRLRMRNADFLSLARRAIYAQPTSAYLELLRIAGCEYGDLERLVQAEGLEGALAILYRRGVYLTVDELKGRDAAVRGSASVAVDTSRVVNPIPREQLLAQTSGSRGARTAVPLNLNAIREAVAYWPVMPLAPNAVFALWMVPGSAALYSLIAHALGGRPTERWFSQVDATAGGLHQRYRWSGHAIRGGGWLARRPIPAMEYAPTEAPWRIVDWMAQRLRAGRIPSMSTFSSSAVMLCQAASTAGVDLAGARFVLTGEPLTEATLEAVRQVGAEATGAYGSTEAGLVSFGCSQAVTADDAHLFTDLHAVIQPGQEGRTASLPAGAMLLTSLRETAPLVLLNTSVGDVATLEDRPCGCPLAAVGWTTHLHTIRSFEKLTAAGMTFLDRDVIHVLEAALPARFGGGPTDYQLVEEAAPDGSVRLRLLVHPAVGPLNADEVADTFLGLIGGGSGVERVMELQWRQAGILRVERQAPVQSASGKIHHLHLDRQPTGRT